MFSDCSIFLTFIGIDIFSPRCVRLDNSSIFTLIFLSRLDTSPNSIHTKRRIWQESISVLLLTDKECHIPLKQEMAFAGSRNSEYPPYLLAFLGTPGERHAENIKVSAVHCIGPRILPLPSFRFFGTLDHRLT